MAANRERITQLIKEKRLFFTVLICNLFLALTVMLFQPLENLLVHVRETAFPVWSIWWIQLLLALFVSAVLTVGMIFLPLKAKRIAALLSFGLGTSFLIQSLLFNNAWPFDMNTTWEMKIGCILIWFWIVLFVISTGYYFLEQREKLTKTVIAALAWFLIVIQTVNFTMLETSYDRLAREPYYLSEAQYEQYTRPGTADLIRLEGTVLSVSMNRGMPYLLKDGFGTENVYENCFGKTGE